MANDNPTSRMQLGFDSPGKHTIFIVEKARMLSPALRNGYKNLFDEVFSEHSPYLSQLDSGDLYASANYVALAIEDGVVVTGFKFTYLLDDAGRKMVISSLVSKSNTKGIAPVLIAATMKFEVDRLGEQIGGEAVVRVLPDGTTNIASQRVLSELGLIVNQTVSVAIRPDGPDAHLTETAEPDGSFRVHVMQARPRDLWRKSGAVLRDWNNGQI